MDQANEITTLLAVVHAQQILLNQLCGARFAVDPQARKEMPETVMGAAMFFSGSMPGMDEERWIDIQARSVVYLRAFFHQVEDQLLKRDEAESGST